MNERTPPVYVRMAIPLDGMTLPGELTLPVNSRGVVIFAHDTPGSRHCSCNTVVADALNAEGIGTLLFDLLSPPETNDGGARARLTADIPLLAARLVTATRWLTADPLCRGQRLGYFGACAGGAASLVAAAWLGQAVDAVVARATHPERADGALERVSAPSLFIVAERDSEMRQHHQIAMQRMHCNCELAVVEGAADLFWEPQAQHQVAVLTTAWFDRYLKEL